MVSFISFRGAGKLRAITPEVVLLIALLADAGDECELWLSYQDRAGFDISELVAETHVFVGAVFKLFGQSHIRHIQNSYFSKAIAFLSTPHVFLFSGDRPSHSLVVKDMEPLVRSTLDRMSTWVAALRLSLKAEFPDWELLQCYQVFSVPRLGESHLGLRHQAVRKGLEIDQIKVRLKRLAIFYKVSPENLINEYMSLVHLPRLRNCTQNLHRGYVSVNTA